MRKISLFLVAAALALPTPASAQITVDRIQQIMDFSAKACPQALVVGREGVETSSSWLTRQAENQGYNVEEHIMLVRFCITYNRGYLAGLKSS